MQEPRYSVLTPSDAERAAELYQLGSSLAEIAAMLHCHPATATRALRRRGVPIRPRGGRRLEQIPLIEIERVRFCYHQLELSYSATSALLGLPVRRVRHIIERNSAPRSLSEAARLRYSRREA